MSPCPYAIAMAGKQKESRFDLRLRLVRWAQREGIREAARAFGCSRNTVRKWLRRYQAGGAGALVEESRAPKRIPHKTSKRQERKVVAARKRLPFGAAQLKTLFALEPSVGAIARILRKRKLTRKLRRKYQKKRDLREIKARYRALEHVQVDVKYLTDLPHYWQQMKMLGLPRFQYTLRDTKSGLLHLGFSDGISVTYAQLFVARWMRHVEAAGVELRKVIVQTDRGGEFSGARRNQDLGFVHTVEHVLGAGHRYTPPGHPNANADVEASHRLIEREFYDIEGFESLDDFLAKAALYQHWFNFGRPNSYRRGRTPWDILKEDRPDFDPHQLLLKPTLLEDFAREREQVGHYVPVVPGASPGAT